MPALLPTSSPRLSPADSLRLYAQIEPAAADYCRAAAAHIREFCRQSAVGLVRVGRHLAEVKSKLKRYTFRRWVAAELPWSRTQCYRLMAAAETFGVLIDPAAPPPEPRIDPTALYLLASPRVTNEAREAAVGLALKERVTMSLAQQIIRATRPRQEEPNEKEVKAYEKDKRQALGTEGDTAPESELTPHERAWDALRSLWVGSRVIHIGRIEEGEEDEDAGQPLATVTVYPDDDDSPVRCVVRRRIDDAVMAAAGLEPEKLCEECGGRKIVSLFGDNRNEADGRNRYCRGCERTRLADVKRRRKGAGKA